MARARSLSEGASASAARALSLARPLPHGEQATETAQHTTLAVDEASQGQGTEGAGELVTSGRGGGGGGRADLFLGVLRVEREIGRVRLAGMR